jgi:predicted  nucleic acid-binding Zn-ribbon protein
MQCKRCGTTVLDDDARTCPVCGTNLYQPDNPGIPEDYDPSEDADVLPQSYMRAPAPDPVSKSIEEDTVNNTKTLQELHSLDTNRAPAHKSKGVRADGKPRIRRVVNHRKGWVDPRKRSKKTQVIS